MCREAPERTGEDAGAGGGLWRRRPTEKGKRGVREKDSAVRAKGKTPEAAAGAGKGAVQAGSGRPRTGGAAGYGKRTGGRPAQAASLAYFLKKPSCNAGLHAECAAEDVPDRPGGQNPQPERRPRTVLPERQRSRSGHTTAPPGTVAVQTAPSRARGSRGGAPGRSTRSPHRPVMTRRREVPEAAGKQD